MRSFEEIHRNRHDVLITGSPELLSLLSSARSSLKVFYLQIEDVEGEKKIVRSGSFSIMVNSSGLLRRVKRLYGIEPLDGIGGVDPGLFKPAPRGSGTPFRAICYGRVSRPRKGTRFVVEALEHLRRRGLNVALDLFDTVNPGDEDPRIGFESDIPCRFYIDLPQIRMSEMYSAADVFVSAEKRAGWSNTAAEAAACGLPLVCTKSGTEDFAVDGESAIILPSRLPIFISRALEKLYYDRELCKKLGEEARKRILEFTWEKLCVKMERQFAELLARA